MEQGLTNSAAYENTFVEHTKSLSLKAGQSPMPGSFTDLGESSKLTRALPAL
jgi:hypothetical protein